MTADQSQTKIIPDMFGLEVLSARLGSYQFPLHFHHTFVVQLILDGADRSCVGTDTLTARRGQVFVHSPGLAHTGGPDGRAALVYRAIYPSIELVCELLNVRPHDIPRSYSAVLDMPNLVRTSRRMFECLEVGRIKAARKLLTELMSRILDGVPSSETHGSVQPKSDAVTNARLYLESNFKRDVTVEELSREVGLSRFHLIREFKRNFSITPRQFLISHRIEIAKTLLKRGRSITDVAFETGFADQSHLNRCFKRLTTVTPGHYRCG